MILLGAGVYYPGEPNFVTVTICALLWMSAALAGVDYTTGHSLGYAQAHTLKAPNVWEKLMEWKNLMSALGPLLFFVSVWYLLYYAEKAQHPVLAFGTVVMCLLALFADGYMSGIIEHGEKELKPQQ